VTSDVWQRQLCELDLHLDRWTGRSAAVWTLEIQNFLAFSILLAPPLKKNRSSNTGDGNWSSATKQRGKGRNR